MLKALPITLWVGIDQAPAPPQPPDLEAEREAAFCLACQEERCLIAYAPDMSKHPDEARCPLERYLLERRRNGPQIPAGYVPVAEAAQRLGVNKSAIYKRIQHGWYRNVLKLGKLVLIAEDEIAP